MNSEVLNIVIDERKRLSSVDDRSILNAGRTMVAGQAIQQRVFKDYIFSSEVYYVDSTLS